MTTKAEVKYNNGEVEVFTITEPTYDIYDGFIHLGANLLVNVVNVTSVQIFEAVPEPDVETEETVEIPATDKYDDEETQLDRIERAIEEAAKKLPNHPYTPNPWVYPNTTIPSKPWTVTNGAKTYATGGVVSGSLEKGEVVTPLDQKKSAMNIYIQTQEGQKIDKLAEEIKRHLQWNSEEIGQRLEKLAEPLTSPLEEDSCRCAENPNEICPDHPYGYYL